ncbi:MAG: hypothetical protein K0S78_3316 [Thermomicrobiales bacterium]|jgi:hypothetical protein|nr:hypothetical protein [Thermomicrobiales bacterium]
MDKNVGPASDLLAEIAGDLWAQANEAVPAVLEDQGDDVAPALRHFVETQQALYERATGQPMIPEAFQLPEPMLHPVNRPFVLVVGWNPGYGPNERVPTLFTPVTEYIEFYRDRFGPLGRTSPQGLPAARNQVSLRLTSIRHYTTVERLLAREGLGDLALSKTATYVDAIPWKGTQPSFQDPAMAAIAWTRISRIVGALQPQLILTLGMNVAGLVKAGHPRNPEARPGMIGGWEGLIVSICHPAAFQCFTNAYRGQVAAVIQDAVAPVT